MILRAFTQMSICHKNRARYTGQPWVFVYMLLRKDLNLIYSIAYGVEFLHVASDKASDQQSEETCLLFAICNIQVT